MRMEHQEFLNCLKRLRFIDRDKLEATGAIPKNDHNAWGEFRRNPFMFFIKAPDEIALKIWDLIKG